LLAHRVGARLTLVERVAGMVAYHGRKVARLARGGRRVAAHARARVACARVVLVARELARRVLLDVDGARHCWALEDLVWRGAADALRGGQVGL